MSTPLRHAQLYPIPSRQNRYGETVRQVIADGWTTTFEFPFSVFSIHDLQVWVDNILYDRGYRVVGAGRRTGGSVLFDAPPPAGARITLKRHLLISRKATITVRGQLSVSGLNAEFDSQVALMRQIEGEVSRCLTWPPGMSFVGRSSTGQIPAGRPVLPFPQPGQALGWSDDGRYLVNRPSVLVRLAHVLEQLQAAGVLADLPSDIRALAQTPAPSLPSSSPPSAEGDAPTSASEGREVDPWTTAELSQHTASLSDEQAWTTQVLQTLQDTLQATNPEVAGPEFVGPGVAGHEVAGGRAFATPMTPVERFGEIIPSVYVRAFPGRMPHVLRLTRSSSATRLRESRRIKQGALVSVAANTLRDDFSPDGQTYYGWRIEGPATNHLGGDLKTRLESWRAQGLRITALAGATEIPSGEANLLQTGTAVGLEATTHQGSLISPSLSGVPDQGVPDQGVPDRGVFSVWMRRLKGSGAIHLTSDKGVTWHEVSAQVTEGYWSRVWAPMKAVTCAPGIRLDRARDAVAVTAMQYEAALGGDDPRPTSTIVPTSGQSGSGESGSGQSGGASIPLQRAGEVLRIEDISARMNAAQGTLYIEALLALAADDPQTLFSSSATPVAVEASIGDVSKGIALNVGGIASGFSGSTSSGQPVQVGVPFRFALSWHREGITAVHDGVVFCESQRGSPWTCQDMALGCQLRNGPTRFLYGWIRRCAIFSERLTSQHLVAMTRP